MRDPLWPAGRVSDGHRDRQAVRREQDELLQTQAVHNRLEVEEPGVKRVVGHVAVRKPSASTVVADQHPSAGNLFVPGTPLGYLGVARGKAEGYRWHPYERRPLPQRAKSDAHAVRGLGVLGGWLHDGAILSLSPFVMPVRARQVDNRGGVSPAKDGWKAECGSGLRG